jgi:hypothetical protein
LIIGATIVGRAFFMTDPFVGFWFRLQTLQALCHREAGSFVERTVLFARFSAIMAIVENLASLARQWAATMANWD